MNKKILLAEDDKNLGIVLTDYLTVKGFDMTLAEDGEEGFRKFNSGNYDLLILDVMMPKLDGFNLAKKIREKDKKTPIIFLTAKSMTEDRIEGLKLGADDYLTKPFSTEELLLRMNNIFKRIELADGFSEDDRTEFSIGSYNFDTNKRILSGESSERKLTSKETALLKLLCIYENKLLDRSTALNTVWGEDNYFTSRSMDVYISKLRSYLKEDANIEIANMHGSGFKLIISS
jgi:DNA-binding response OmpR family regulator